MRCESAACSCAIVTSSSIGCRRVQNAFLAAQPPLPPVPSATLAPSGHHNRTISASAQSALSSLWQSAGSNPPSVVSGDLGALNSSFNVASSTYVPSAGAARVVDVPSRSRSRNMSATEALQFGLHRAASNACAPRQHLAVCCAAGATDASLHRFTALADHVVSVAQRFEMQGSLALRRDVIDARALTPPIARQPARSFSLCRRERHAWCHFQNCSVLCAA